MGLYLPLALTALNAGQSAVECKARVSEETMLLTELPFVGANLVILGRLLPDANTGCITCPVLYARTPRGTPTTP